ncbi:MAG: electron transfer flavoprotein subunit alpha/FixB family protein [Candidatus Aminicenantes bacterium]|nr:electron transfer flavoprotein subunit alpha/FixB family protein [Candidatus Aminicenantes bacterium]
MILTYIEIRDGKIKKSSLETLSEASRKARETGTAAEAVVVGACPETAGADLGSAGASKVHVLESPELSVYSSQGFVRALETLVRETAPAAVFFPATAMGRDLAPRLAARLDVSLASDCTAVDISSGRIVFTRPVFAGKARLTLALTAAPAIATLRPNVFPLEAANGASAEVVKKTVDIPVDAVGGRVSEIVCEMGAVLDVSEAEIVVSGGRAMKGPEGFTQLSELAALLPRSAVGASRTAVDSGWIGHSHQVGQTGKTVSPNLYFAFGISGAIQHMAGMSSSKVIVAVNKDPEAPMFKVADYGIVGDLFAVIPALAAELKTLA